MSVQAQIDELLVADAPTLARLEQTLTDGYAEALELETERLRIERRLRSLRERLNALNQRARALRAQN
ncbi:MAG TPA: hypothetical protein VFM96_02595 [Gaiellaceae bacterium]|nr:hypothetical protein [Gaiellaceae bacterium]